MFLGIDGEPTRNCHIITPAQSNAEMYAQERREYEDMVRSRAANADDCAGTSISNASIVNPKSTSVANLGFCTGVCSWYQGLHPNEMSRCAHAYDVRTMYCQSTACSLLRHCQHVSRQGISPRNRSGPRPVETLRPGQPFVIVAEGCSSRITVTLAAHKRGGCWAALFVF